jgi:hypothetical protein
MPKTSAPPLPSGWRLIRRVPAKRCPTCGHEDPERVGELLAPGGQRHALIGNRSARQEDEMVAAFLAARGLAPASRRNVAAPTPRTAGAGRK